MKQVSFLEICMNESLTLKNHLVKLPLVRMIYSIFSKFWGTEHQLKFRGGQSHRICIELLQNRHLERSDIHILLYLSSNNREYFMRIWHFQRCRLELNILNCCLFVKACCWINLSSYMLWSWILLQSVVFTGTLIMTMWHPRLYLTVNPTMRFNLMTIQSERFYPMWAVVCSSWE